jgi:two-component system response regulator LytT
MIHKQRVILIEDEFLARDELKDILRRKHRDVEVAGEADNPKEGWELIERCGADGVFLDINLESGSRREGMDLAYNIARLAKPPWIVFITGYPEFALEAHDIHPAHYLLKPLDDDRVAKALGSVTRHRPPRVIEITHRVDDRYGNGRLAVAYVEPQAEILYVCTVPDSAALRVHLLGCHDLLGVAGPLRNWQERLAPYGFETIHKGHLVNLAFRAGLLPHPVRDDSFQLALKGGCPDRVPVSRHYRRESG